MADTTEPAVDASGMNKPAALNYTAADAAAGFRSGRSLQFTQMRQQRQLPLLPMRSKENTKQSSSLTLIPLSPLSLTRLKLRKKAVSLTVTNKTGMFNVTDAVLDNDKPIVTLHGTGYRYLYKGTYEEAVANGDNRDKWIAGDNSSGKWQFTIPVAEGETSSDRSYLPQLPYQI